MNDEEKSYAPDVVSVVHFQRPFNDWKVVQ